MSIKKYDGINWVDAQYIRRYENESWKDLQYIRKCDGINWIDIFPYNVFKVIEIPNTLGTNTNISKDYSRLDYVVNGSGKAETVYLKVKATGNFGKEVKLSCFLNMVLSIEMYGDINVHFNGDRASGDGYIYNSTNRQLTINYNSQNNIKEIVIFLGAYGSTTNKGYIKDLQINGLTYKIVS